MKYYRLVAIVGLILSVSSCGEFTLKKSQTNYKGWEVYETEAYSVQYPKSWRLDTTGYRGTDFSIFSAQTSLLDKFIENVSLTIHDIDSSVIDLSTYMSFVEGNIKTVSIDSSLLLSERIDSAAIAFQKVQYKVKQGAYIAKLHQYYYLKNNKVYVLALTSTESEFKNYLERGEKMMNSFHLK